MQRQVGRGIADLVLLVLRVVPPKKVHVPVPWSPWTYFTHGAPSSSPSTVMLGLSRLRMNDVVSP